MLRYDAELLAALAALGICPRPETPPERVREAVNDLYRYELRCLRDRLVRREIPKAGYSQRVIELRRRYWMLSWPLQHWTEAAKKAEGAEKIGDEETRKRRDTES